MKQFLQDIGINIGISIAGLFGSLLLIGKTSAHDLKTTIISLISGVASANYLTPMVSDLFAIKMEYQYGIAFVLGFLGLKGVEKVSEKFMK
jgi:hypothetical protein